MVSVNAAWTAPGPVICVGTDSHCAHVYQNFWEVPNFDTTRTCAKIIDPHKFLNSIIAAQK